MNQSIEERIRQTLANHERTVIREAHLKPSAVLIPMFQRGDEPHLLFTLRTSWLKDHAGQISFPGGRRDREDKNLAETALRETFEEIGIHASDVEILGELDDTATRSNYVITPYVGIFPHPYHYTIDTHEVAEVLEVPLSTLLDKHHFREEQNPETLPFPPPLWLYREHIIWGATARITKQFLELVFNF